MSEDVYENYRENMKNTIMRNNSYSDEMKYSQGLLKQLNEAKEKVFELEQQLKTAKPKLYRHVKTGGVYEFITGAQNESDMECVVVYKSVGNGIVWVRSNKEFYDGRFEEYTNNLEGK